MSKRSLRCVRHRTDFQPQYTFRELVLFGQQERCIRLGLPFSISLTKEQLEQAPVAEELVIPPPEVFAEMKEMTPNDPFVQAVEARLDTATARVLSEEEANQVRQELFPQEPTSNEPSKPTD